MYSYANLLSYSFYIESSFLLLFIFYILYVLYTIMCMNQINNRSNRYHIHKYTGPFDNVTVNIYM